MQQIAASLTSWMVKAFRVALRMLMRLEAHFQDGFKRKAHNREVIRSTCKYDMFHAADEGYYTKQYWKHISALLESQKSDPNGNFLDLGCGQGRISIPFAKNWCQGKGKITGVDISEQAIKQAEEYASEAGVHNVQFIVSDLFDYLKTLPDQSLDGVFFLEVVFFLPGFESALDEVARILKPGGFLFASFRSQYFNLLNIIQQGMWHSVDTIINKRSGAIRGGAVHYNWHTLSDLQQLLVDKLHFKILNICGIGLCSGIPGDPHSLITRPSGLNKEEAALLMKAEVALSDSVPEAGRYVLIGARR